LPQSHDETDLHRIARADANARVEDEVVANSVRNDDFLTGRPIDLETSFDEGLLDFLGRQVGSLNLHRPIRVKWANMKEVKNRRSLTPDIGVPAVDGAHPVRRGGARHEVTDRVRLVGKNMKLRDGWALNISRGGVRAILEENVDLGEEYEITIGEEGTPGSLTRKGRVVWVQDEPDGVIVGFEFILASGAHALAPDDVPKPDDE